MICGVTGRIASGKSTASKILSNRGYYLIDADKIYNQLYLNNEFMKNELLNEFGSLDKSVILKKITSNKEKLKLLNKITHKYVTREFNKIIKDKKNTGVNNFVLDVPIPVKEGFIDLCDKIIVLDAPVETQITRLKGRNNLNTNEAVKRIALQMNRQDYFNIGDIVISTENMSSKDLEKVIYLLF